MKKVLTWMAFVVDFGMYIEKIETPNIYGMGDTHGLPVILDLVKHYDLKDCVLIHVGDAGEGFGHNPIMRDKPHLEEELDPYLEEHNIKLLIVRGNHSNPSYFKPDHYFNQNLKNIEFVQDFSYKTINNKVFIFAGGATSIDRTTRTVGLDYWRDEVFKLPDLEQLKPADILISHSMPSECQPYGFSNIRGWLAVDLHLKDQLVKERQDISTLVAYTGVSQVWGGHFHMTMSERIDNVYYRIININEIASITSYIQ